MKTAILLSIGLIVGAGTVQVAKPAPTQVDQRLLSVVDAALERVEVHGGKVDVIVVAPTVADPIKAQLRRLRGAITSDEVPSDAANKLPAGYFLVKVLRVDDDKAFLSGTLGPIPAPREGVVLLACGTGFNIDIARTGEKWVGKVSSLVVC